MRNPRETADASASDSPAVAVSSLRARLGLGTMEGAATIAQEPQMGRSTRSGRCSNVPSTW